MTTQFLKPAWIDKRGFNEQSHTQIVSVTHYATLGLQDGNGHVVSLSDPSIADLVELEASHGLRLFRVTGRAIGHSNLEARSASGAVAASMTIKVRDHSGKRIVIHLADQTVEAFDGGIRDFLFECVTGDHDHPTDPGRFRVSRKVHPCRSIKYDVQMNHALFFTGDGKALHQYHGPIPIPDLRRMRLKSDFFGSHGCVRLSEADAAELYKWTSVGTVVDVVHRPSA